MAWALVGTIGAASQGAAGADVTPAWGTSENRTAGNLLVCYVSITGSAGIPTTPTGWDQLTVGANSTAACIFFKAATGSDAAPTITHPDANAVIAAQLAEYSGVLSTTADRTGTGTTTGNSLTVTNGGADTATSELMTIASSDTRGAARTPTDTLTSNHVTTMTQAGNNNGTSSKNHYSFGYGTTNSTASADTAVVTPSSTQNITGLALVDAVWKLGVGSKVKTLTADAVTKRNQTGSFTADADIKRTGISATFTADAVLLKTQTGSFTADAKISLLPGFTADAVIKATIGASNWVQRTSGFGSTQINAVGFDGTYWVIVGNSGTMAYAIDPTGTWTIKNAGFGTSIISGVLYANSLWVAMGIDGKYATATDPTGTWTQGTQLNATLSSIGFGNGNWVLNGLTPRGGTTVNLWTTTDPTVGWTSRGTPDSAPSDSEILSVAYGGTTWTSTGFAGKVYTATDPTSTWTSRGNQLSFSHAGVGVGYDGTNWTIVGGDSDYSGATGLVQTATNPTSTWTRNSGPYIRGSLTGVAYGNGVWVLIGSGGQLWTATDPTSTWTRQNSSFGSTKIGNTYGSGVAYGNGIWVAAGSNGLLATSSNPTYFLGFNADADFFKTISSSFAANACITGTTKIFDEPQLRDHTETVTAASSTSVTLTLPTMKSGDVLIIGLFNTDGSSNGPAVAGYVRSASGNRTTYTRNIDGSEGSVFSLSGLTAGTWLIFASTWSVGSALMPTPSIGVGGGLNVGTDQFSALTGLGVAGITNIWWIAVATSNSLSIVDGTQAGGGFFSKSDVSTTTGANFINWRHVGGTSAATKTGVQTIGTVPGASTAEMVISLTLPRRPIGADAVTKTVGTSGSFTADAVLKKNQTGSFTADADLLNFPSSFTADADLLKTQVGTFTANSFIPGHFTADANIVTGGAVTHTGSFTADADVLKTQTGTLTADADLKATETSTFTANAVLFRTITGSFSADAVLLKTQTGSFTANADILRTQTSSFSADALIVRLVLHDTFTRTVADGLGVADDGTVYQTYPDLTSIGLLPTPTSVDGSEAKALAGGVSTVYGYFDGYRVPRRSLVQFDVFVPSDPTDPNFVFEVDVLWDGDPAQGIPVSFVYVNSGTPWTFAAGNALTQITPDASTWYRVKGWVGNGTSDDTSRIKAWKVGDPEPDWAPVSDVGPHYNFWVPPLIYLGATPTQDALLDNLYIWSASSPDSVFHGLTADAVVGSTETSSFSADAFIAGQFRADADLKATISGSFTAQADFDAPEAGFFTGQAVIFRNQTGSFSADAVVFRTTTSSFTANAVLSKTTTGSLTADATLVRTMAGAYTADAVLRKTSSGTLTGDAAILRTETGSITADAATTRTQSGTFTADAVVLRTSAGSISADADLRATETSSLSGDAVVQRTETSSFHADAFVPGQVRFDADLLRTQTHTITADAFIPGHFNVDADIQRTQSSTFSADAFIQGVGVFAVSADAVFIRTQAGSISGDADIQRASSGAFSGNGVVLRTQSGSFTGDAVLLRPSTGNFSANAIIKSQISGTFHEDAVVERTTTGSLTANAVQLKTQSASLAADAVLRAGRTSGLSADAVLLSHQAGSLHADGVLQRTASSTFRADADIRTTATNAITANAFIPGHLSADAVLLRATSSHFSAQAVQQKTLQGQLVADAALRRVHQTLLSAEAVLQRTTPEAFTANAVISRSVTGGIVADASLFRSTAGSIASDAFIAWHFSADASITASPTTAFSADAYIEQVIPGTVSGDLAASTISAGCTVASISAGITTPTISADLSSSSISAALAASTISGELRT